MLVTSVSPPPPFCVVVARYRGEIVVAPVGELDMVGADVLDSELRALDVKRGDRVVLDLRNVGFLDSTGLRLLLSLRAGARREGHGLALVPGPRRVQRVFELTGTRGLFDWRG